MAVSVQTSDDVNIVWEDEEEEEEDQSPSKTSLKSTRWDNLSPKIKARIVQSGQERAMANKKKREGKHTQKRRE